MEPVDNNSEQPTRKSGSRTFIIIAIIIVVSIAAFLILRPNPSGTTPQSTPASPATSQ
jgi:flagellar basal body-associated protein FliL